MGSVLIALLLVLAAPAFAAEPQPHLGAHFKDSTVFKEVVDLRCTRCHDRERVLEAMSRQEDLIDLQRRMIGHGAVLTPRDKNVLGTFWGTPLQERGEPPLQRSEQFEK